MQVGILVYKDQVVGNVKFEASQYDYSYNYYNLFLDGAETGLKCELNTYLFFPRSEFNKSRSVYDKYNYNYPYDGRVPFTVHKNHGRPINKGNRVLYVKKILEYYTCYALDDNTFAYTTPYKLMNNYYEYGYTAWTLLDTYKIIYSLSKLDNDDNNNYIDYYNICMNLLINVLLALFEFFYMLIIFYIFFMVIDYITTHL